MKLLDVQGLTIYFGGLAALRDVSFHVDEGEIVSLIGPNGAGKTTVFNLMTGFLRPTKGRIFYRGRDLGGTPSHEASRRGIARTFQKTEVFPEVTVLTGVLIGLHKAARAPVWDVLLGTRRKRAHEERVADRAREIIGFVGLAGKEGEVARNLAYGDLRLLEIAVALAADPELLLLDEPTAGMNPEETRRVTHLIGQIRAKGVTVLLVEHDMNVVMGISDRVVVLDHGEKIAEGVPDEIRQNADVIRAYLGAGFAGGTRGGTAVAGDRGSVSSGGELLRPAGEPVETPQKPSAAGRGPGGSARPC